MYNRTIYNALVNVVPFWSANIGQVFGLGNEYNIVFNMIVSELLKISSETFSDVIWIIITFVIIICMCGYKFGFLKNLNIFSKNTIIITGKEINNIGETNIEYCDKILAMNNYLINVKKYKNITYLNDVNIIINETNNYKLANDIYLTITRIYSQNSNKDSQDGKIVKYELWSYNKDIEQFINFVVDEYKKISNSEITLIGSEANETLNYPEPIHAINYYISVNYNFPKLKCMKMLIATSAGYEINNNSNSQNSSNSQNPPNFSNSETKQSKKNNYSYALDNVLNYDLGKVSLNIHRNGTQVFYNIKSNLVNCKDWLEGVTNIYNQNKNCKFKNKLIFTGREEIWLRENSFKQYYYSKEMWVLNWLLIEKLNYQNYECVNGDEKMTLYKYVLEPLELYKIKEDLYLSVEKEKVQRNYYYSYNSTSNQHNNDTNIIYSLYSNTLNIKDVMSEYVKQFDDYKNKIGVNKILYHFTYSGLKDNKLVFNSRVLSEENTPNELFETFDKIHNEHVITIKNDIDRLKNAEYYKKHGLKRKKGYLFYGIPGCGKTSSVIAMALYDSRHIVEIPFGLLTKHDEFEEIMNLKSINNIEINNNNIILLFDEIDIGMEKIGSRKSLNENMNSINPDPSTMIISEAMTKIFSDPSNPAGNNTIGQKINLATLLSKLDGIGNYNGLIIVGTTNCIEKLDPALYRELRLTPIEFTYLRKCDCVEIIQSYFDLSDKTICEELYNLIPDRKIIPTTLISLCQTHDHLSFEDFLKTTLQIFLKKFM